jgi:hypothetical protein
VVGFGVGWAFGAVAVVASSSDDPWVAAVAAGRCEAFPDFGVGLSERVGVPFRGKNPPGR